MAELAVAMSLQFTSVLDKFHKSELEELLFFHPHQGRFASSIVGAVEKHGVPTVVEQDNHLRVKLVGSDDAQTLYVVMESLLLQELVGAVIYTRTSEGTLVILHIAVKKEYTQEGEKSGQQVTLQLIQEICRIARQVQGIKSVQLGYKRSHNFLKTDLFRVS